MTEPPIYRPFALLALTSAIAGGIVLRTALAPWILFSVLLVWIAVACAAANLVAAYRPARAGGARLWRSVASQRVLPAWERQRGRLRDQGATMNGRIMSLSSCSTM